MAVVRGHRGLSTDVDRESVQALGIMNIGSIVPTALAPLIAGYIITSHTGYPVLFRVVGVTAVVGAVLVYRVRSVR